MSRPQFSLQMPAPPAPSQSNEGSRPQFSLQLPAPTPPAVVEEKEEEKEKVKGQPDEYMLGRSINDSIRLDAQHLLWKMYLGYTLHPKIPITAEMKIAELGTGTGIWLFDASRSLPHTVDLHGYDISDGQFPPREFWPWNVRLGVLDSLTSPPTALLNLYDVVHVRMWASNLKNNDIGPLVQHTKLLLKPGGYIQWEDADLINQAVRGDEAVAFASLMSSLFKQANLQYDWVSQLPRSLPIYGLEVLEASSREFQHDLIQLCTNTYLAALAEILQGIERRAGSESEFKQVVKEQQGALAKLSQSSNTGMIYNWIPTSVLAQKGAIETPMVEEMNVFFYH